MSEKGILIKKRPRLKNPILMAGFDGWGNAMNISRGMVSYLIRKLKATYFARLDPDMYYHYDESRPFVDIKDGELISFSPPGGSFYAVRSETGKNDLIILRADEPNLRWFHFANALFSLCKELEVKRVITLGSMYDNVLHTDRILSGISSSEDSSARLKEKKIAPVSYQGPSAIHAILMSEGLKRGFESISLWCHCPYYLQGATHFGLLSHLGLTLSSLGGFELDVTELETSWAELNDQIQALIESTPELQSVIDELHKAKMRGSWERMRESAKKGDKVINLKDFLPPE
jgi:proteasome assembly chaperone (PAC2) family protein